MKLSTKLLIYTLCFCANTRSAFSDDTVTQEVMHQFHRLVKAAEQRDISEYFNLVDMQKFVGLNSNGRNWNSAEELKSQLVDGFRAISAVNSLDFTNLNLSIIDQYTVVLVNEYQQMLTLTSGQIMAVKGGGTQVWSKRSGIWKLVSISSSLNDSSIQTNEK